MALVHILLGVLVAFFRLSLYPYRLDSCSYFISEEVSAVRCYRVALVGSYHPHLMHNYFAVDGSIPSRYCCWLNCLLFMAGDIALNPGPARFPCTVCTRPVRINQSGIECDACHRWTHTSCSDVSVDLYNQMEAQVEFSWYYPSCLFLELPLVDVSDVSSLAADECSTDADLSIVNQLGAAIQGIRIVHHNIQGIHSKLTELTQWFETCENTATIFCFTETWLKLCSPRVVVPGYTVLTSPILCRPNKTTSYLPGSCIIVSNFVTIERPPVCENVENSCQLLNVVCCFINSDKGAKVCIISVYRSPSTYFRAGLDELQSVLLELLLYCQHIIVAGDFNVDLLTQSSTGSVYTEFLTRVGGN